MTDIPKLSFIVPVYNTEEYLRECVECLLVQDYADCEVILVDDGSPDGSGAICDEYARRDSRVKVVHQQNAGLSAARNTGLDVARGEFVAFVDSDDSVAFDTYAVNIPFLLADPELDWVEFPVSVHCCSPWQQIWKPGRRRVAGQPDVFTDWINSRRYVHSYAWNKIFRRTLFQDVRFPTGKNFEDVFILPRLLHRARAVLLSDVGLYYYRYREGSITVRSTAQTLRDRLDAFLALYHEARSFEACRKECVAMYLRIVDTLIEWMRAPDADASAVRHACDVLRHDAPTLSALLRLNVPVKVKVKNLSLACLGLDTHCRLYARLHREPRE